MMLREPYIKHANDIIHAINCVGLNQVNLDEHVKYFDAMDKENADIPEMTLSKFRSKNIAFKEEKKYAQSKFYQLLN